MRLLHEMYGIWTPAVDIYETAGVWLVYVELPGVLPQDMNLTVLSESIVIRGRKSSPARGLAAEKLEIFTGSFLREVQLPGTIRISEVTAKMGNGVLIISLPIQDPVSVRIPVDGPEEPGSSDEGE